MPYTKAQAKEKITKLVEDFRAHERTLERAPEAEIENSFIRPLFEALNWNTTNQGLSYAQYEFKVQATNKKGLRPDYILHVDGRDVLVMDAKQVKYSMRDPRWLYQVYSYAYSTQNSKPSEKIDFAILTDFQEFIVLDCTLYAAKPEAVNNFRVIDWKYSDYVEQFDTLWDLFERNNVLNASRPHDGRGAVTAPDDTTNTSTEQDSSPNKTGSVTRAGVPRPYGLWSMYLSPQKVKANRVAPDKAFLAQMDDEKDGWRVVLAKDMKKRNPRADGELITAAVQLLIDRLIFIKALSDREVDRDYLSEIESRITEAGLGEHEAGWFASCKNIFEELNNFYNGSIFEPRPELENVSVGNRAVQAVLHDLQPENSPYNFAVLPVEILGTIYERFLGRVVRTTEKRVTIEDKPEVRKAGGVYYTPQYIVDYIVENTLGKLLADCKTPADVAKLKILDPSCGSGSFLLGAYSKLIDWHKDYYARAGKEKRDRASFYRDEGGLIRLTAKLKRDILKNNLYGVDIDPQAVEVTRFSLSLKALEDLREGELTEERTLFHQTVLPDLSGNIKNGNSLIGTDYFTGQMFTDPEEMKRVNAFDWSREFPDILSGEDGGFDCIIGNPPYGATFSENDKAYFRNYYKTSQGRFESYQYFMEKGISITRNGGYFSLIVPDTWFTLRDAELLRRMLLNETSLEQLLGLHENVFEKVKVDVCIFIVLKSGKKVLTKVKIASKDHVAEDFIAGKFLKEFEFNQSEWLDNKESNIVINVSNSDEKIISKLEKKGIPLETIAIATTGPKPYQVGKGIPPQTKQTLLMKPFTSEFKKDKTFRIMLRGSDISRYSFPTKQDEWLSYGEWLAEVRDPSVFERERLLVQSIRNPKLERRIVATYVNDKSVNNNSITNVVMLDNNKYSIRYVLGILNSSLINWLFAKSYNIVNIDPRYLKRVFIHAIDFSKPDEKAQHDKMVALVEQMLSLHKSKAEAQIQAQADVYERQIRAVDESIDTLVYQLYGLTPEEVKIVEG